MMTIFSGVGKGLLAMGAIAATSLVFSESAQALTVTLGFDDFTPGTPIAGDTFASQGVTFDQDLSAFPLEIGAGPVGAAVAVPFAGSVSGFFDGTIDFLSLVAGDNAPSDIDDVTLIGFDEFDNVIDSATFSAALGQTLSISGAGITRFELNNTNNSRIGFDDFTFNLANDDTTPVPTPAAVLPVIGGLFASARRKQNNVTKDS